MADQPADNLTEHRREIYESLAGSLSTLQQSINWSILCTGSYWQNHLELLTTLAKARSIIDQAIANKHI